MKTGKTSGEIDLHRRRFFGTAAISIAAAQLILGDSAHAQPGKAKPAELPNIKPGTNTSFRPLKQVDAGVLNVGYAEAGPANGPAIILRWPDIPQLRRCRRCWRRQLPRLSRTRAQARRASGETIAGPASALRDIVANGRAQNRRRHRLPLISFGRQHHRGVWPGALQPWSRSVVIRSAPDRDAAAPKPSCWWYRLFRHRRGRAEVTTILHDLQLIWQLAPAKWVDDATFDRSTAS
jgi:hypothetical protein